MKFKKILLTLGLLFMSVPAMFSQTVGIKTNLLYDATLSPTLGLEFGLAPKWSLDVSGTLNAWTINPDSEDWHKWKHWLVMPEARYWFCQRFAGHFLGVHALGGQYNIGQINIGGNNFLGTNLKYLEDHRVQGWYVGAGIAYGYSWILDKHWNIEAEIGIGWAYTRYDAFNCEGCGKKIEEDKPHNYYGPTKAALNLIYYF